MNAKRIIFIIVIILFSTGVYFAPRIIEQWQWKKIASEANAASGSYPVQFGLINTAIIKCVPVPTSMICPQHRLCATKPAGACGNYTVIAGTPMGGDGAEIIIDSIQYSMSGYIPGSPVIAAGLSNSLIQIIATPNGCSGCR